MSKENYQFMCSEAYYETKRLLNGDHVAYSTSGKKGLGPTPDAALTALRQILADES